MPTREYREVDFHKYCPKCKYLDIEDIMDPCNECLGEPCNKNSEKPIYYEPDEEVKLWSRWYISISILITTRWKHFKNIRENYKIYYERKIWTYR